MANPSIQETSSSTRKPCSSCQGFDIYLFSSLPDETLVLAVGEVAEAAAAGCNFCKFMHEAAKGQFTELPWKNTGELNKHYWIHVACLGWDSRPGEPRYNKLWLDINPNKFRYQSFGDDESSSPLALDYEICISADVGQFVFIRGIPDSIARRLTSAKEVLPTNREPCWADTSAWTGLPPNT